LETADLTAVPPSPARPPAIGGFLGDSRFDSTSSREHAQQFDLSLAADSNTLESIQRTAQYQRCSDTMKRAGRTEQEIKQQQREGNIYTAEFKLKLMLNMLDTHEFIEKLQAAGLSRTLQSFPRFLEFC
jgi:hypothetical protein